MLAKSVKLPNLLLLFPTGVQSLWSNYNPLLLSNTALWNLMWTSGPLLTTHQLNIWVLKLSENIQMKYLKSKCKLFSVSKEILQIFSLLCQHPFFYKLHSALVCSSWGTSIYNSLCQDFLITCQQLWKLRREWCSEGEG